MTSTITETPRPHSLTELFVAFTVLAGESLRLKFGVLLHASPEPLDPAKAAPTVNAEMKAWK